MREYTLIGADGEPHRSTAPGIYGGHRVGKGYGRLDCPAALAAIARGGPYPHHRVFFADEATALAAGYRPCGRCLRDRYAAWKAQSMTVWLPMPEPFAARELHTFLARRAIPGLESATSTTFTRGPITLDFAARPELVPHTGTRSGLGVQPTLARPEEPTASVGESGLGVRIEGIDAREGMRIARRVVDAGADPRAIDAHLAASGLSDFVEQRPGLRAPGAFDPWEIVVRAIVGQAISVKAARTILTRLHDQGLLTDRDKLAATDPRTLPLPGRRSMALIEASNGAELQQVKGVGPWTRNYIALRTGDSDVLLDTDLIVRRSAQRHGIDLHEVRHWAPYRTYVTHHLWAAA